MPPISLTGRANDRWGAGLSIACLAHCLAGPVVASLLPIAALVGLEWVHWVFALLAATIAWVSLLRPGTQVERRTRTLAGFGVVLLFAGAAEFPMPSFADPVTVAGALLLATAHFTALRSRP